MYTHTPPAPTPRSPTLAYEIGFFASRRAVFVRGANSKRGTRHHHPTGRFQGVGNFVVLANFVLGVLEKAKAFVKILRGVGSFPPPRCLMLGLVGCTVSHSRQTGRHAPPLGWVSVVGAEGLREKGRVYVSEDGILADGGCFIGQF